MTTVQTIRFVLVMVPLAAWAWLGIAEGLNGWQDAASPGQRVCAASQILSGVAAITCLIALVAHPSWLRLAFVVWAALVCWGAFAGESAWRKNQPRS